MARSRKRPLNSLRPLEKSATGVRGLDAITDGGLPRGRPTLRARRTGIFQASCLVLCLIFVSVSGPRVAADPSPPLVGYNFLVNGGAIFDQQDEGRPMAANCKGVFQILPYIVDGIMVQCGSSVAEVWCQRVSDAPAVAGLTSSVKCAVAAPAASTLGPTDLLGLVASIAGDDMAATGFGTANALPVCVSFWVKASVAGTYALAFNSDSATGSYVKMFAVPNANEWGQVAICFPGETTADNWGVNGIVNITFAAGPRFTTGVSEGWNSNQSAAATTAIGQTLFQTRNATVQVTGLKFEVGTTPTPFVEVPLVEFPRVLEYAEKSYDQGVPVGTENSTKGQVTYVAHSSAGIIAIPFGQACRTQLPLMTVYSPATGNSGMVRDTTVSSDIAAGWQNVGTSGATISFTAVPGHIYTAQWFKDCRI